MPRPLAIDLRERAVAAVLQGGRSRHRGAARFGVAPSTVINRVRRFQATGGAAPGQMGGRKPKAIAGEHPVFLVQRISDREFALRGLVAELAGRGLKVDYRSVGNFVHAEKLSFKKTVIASERDAPTSPGGAPSGLRSKAGSSRSAWSSSMRPGPSFDRLKTNMAPLRGWAPRGARLVAKVPHGHWKTLTFVAALRHDRIAAPFVRDGPINGECFKTYVERVLVPTLAAGDRVMMDNLGSRKGKAIRRTIRAAGAALFFLPKYAPDLIPIEQVFAKLKHLLRKAAARTVEAAIGQLLATYTPQQRTNYFTHAG